MAAMAMPSMATAMPAVSSISTRFGSRSARSIGSALVPKSSRLVVSKARGVSQKRHVNNGSSSPVQELAEEEGTGSAAGAAGDSVVSEVAVLEEEPETPGVSSGGTASSKRKSGPLQRGGSLSGTEALGKDPSAATLGKTVLSGAFDDSRWVKGTWDLAKFTKDGKVNWDSVIDAEVKRRRWLEENPEASSESEPTTFESGSIPWWAWVKRFHLPEAELLNGRAAMVGYLAAYVVDSATGVGLVDQQNSFLGKLLLFITIAGVLLIRKNEDVETLKTLAQESTFYDKQWQATWKEDSKKEEKPSE